MPAQERLWLDDEKCLLPGPHHSGQQDQEHAVRPGTGRSFHLSPQNNELLTEESILCDKFGLASGKVGQRPQQERGSVWFGPGNQAVVERPRTQACHACDERENPLHSVHSPFVKMSRCTLSIVLFLWGIGKEQETA
jgi:hypothetical protein